jgi:hypothetical protein
MRSGKACLRVLAGLAGLIVAGSAIAQAVRQGSWAPVYSESWLLGVVAAVWPRAGHGRCRAWITGGRQVNRPAG